MTEVQSLILPDQKSGVSLRRIPVAQAHFRRVPDWDARAGVSWPSLDAATVSASSDPWRRAIWGLTRFQVRPSLTIEIVPRWSVRRRGISFLRKRLIVSE